MPQTLSNTTYPISPGFTKNASKRTKEFGDDRYRDIKLDGVINLDLEEWSVTWVPMYYTTAIALETLLKNSLTSKANYLYWTGPGESSAHYYTASSIQRKIIGPYLLQISATLTRRNIPV